MASKKGKMVSLRERKLMSVPKGLGAECEHLDLTGNKITSFDGLKSMKSLKRLILDKNDLETLKGLPTIPSLKTLWLNNNSLSDLRNLVELLQKATPNLCYLSLMRNPLCPNMYFSDGSFDKEYSRYRLLLIYKLKTLKFLDATKVSAKERKLAEAQGPSLELMFKSLILETKSVETTPKSKKLISPPKKPAAFLAKGYVRYSGTASEGNRFILNSEL
mmetsp:Transcript_9571/g.14352  ORF Transcript_9571/g.14352 Transcript_9571/m.14352 type:complete len:218 (+) Transcript_9571:24-677(+)